MYYNIFSGNNNNSSLRMSPTEFSNYIKQRQMQQQIHHSHGQPIANHFGHVSPSRSLSPNHLNLTMQSNDQFYFPLTNNGVYHQFSNNSHRNIFGNIGDTSSNSNNFQHESNSTLYNNGHTKYPAFIEHNNSFLSHCNG